MTHQTNPIPLVIDLDGTLINTDMLHESISYTLTHRPLGFIAGALGLLSNKQTGKAHFAQSYRMDTDTLPYHTDVINWLRQQKAEGRQLVLATATHHTLAQRIADYLGLFDLVIATDASTNLKAEHKRDALIAKFGYQQFDYMGDSSADLPVWEAARDTYAVNPSAKNLSWLRQNTSLKKVFSTDQKNPLLTLLKALRPHQWAKNALIFVPLLTAHLYTDLNSILVCLLGFILFSMTASSVYLLNDIVDVRADRLHPRKRHRPFASGQLSLVIGWLIWPLLALLSLGLSWWLMPIKFTIVLSIYYLSTLVYSFYIKRLAITDAITLGGLYALRIIAGVKALGLLTSFWLLSFSAFLFLSLAFVKRVSELKSLMRDASPSSPKQLNGRGYVTEDLDLVTGIGVASGLISVVFLSLYVADPKLALIYKTPDVIWFTCPILLFWITRIWLLTNRGQMHDDPVLFALKDPVSWLSAGGFLATFIVANLI